MSLASFPRPPSPFLTFFACTKNFVYNIHACKKKVRKGEGEPGNEATEAILFSVTSLFGENFSSKVYSTIHYIYISLLSLTFAVTVVRAVSVQPDIFRRAGTTNRLKVTAADTGLPGSANTSLLLPFLTKVAKVVGFLH